METAVTDRRVELADAFLTSSDVLTTTRRRRSEVGHRSSRRAPSSTLSDLLTSIKANTTGIRLGRGDIFEAFVEVPRGPRVVIWLGNLGRRDDHVPNADLRGRRKTTAARSR